MLLIVFLVAIIAAAVIFYCSACYVHKTWVNPARVTLAPFETSEHLKGESYEVQFTPYEPGIFVHDPVRENYTMVINSEGFGLKTSFPASLYSHHCPLFFSWPAVSSMERSFLTNVLVKVKGREQGFCLYAGIKGARRLLEEWHKRCCPDS